MTVGQAPARASPTPSARFWPGDFASSPIVWQALTAAVFVLGGVMSALRRTDVDVAWLLTLGEKMVGGQRPYVDFFEANPPMSILLYLPPVFLGRITGIAPDVLVNAFVLTASALSLALSGRILARTIDDRAVLWKLGLAAAFVLTVLPMGVFDQREHIAVIAILPFLALSVARSEGGQVGLTFAGLAGLGCGVAMATKPHFALIAGPPVLIAAWRLRSWRPLLAVEIWTASLVVGLYALALVIVFPAFLSFLPIVRETYLPVRRPLSMLLTLPAMPIWAVLAGLTFWTAASRRGSMWASAALLAASAGGAASFLIQAKGWPYHSYPMLALSVLALAAASILGVRRPTAAPGRLGASAWVRVSSAVVRVGLATILIALTMQWFTLKGDYHALNAPVEAIAARPKLLSITADIAVGHPLTRELHGQWVGSVCSQWISAGALALERRGGLSSAQRARLDSLMDFDRRLLTRDITRARPDIILITIQGFDWGAWARLDPALAAALGAYEPVQTVDGVAIWARKDRVPAP
jgi:hypothetical protein